MITPPPAGGRVSSINFSICELGLSQEGLLPRDDIIKRVPIVFIKKKKKERNILRTFQFFVCLCSESAYITSIYLRNEIPLTNSTGKKEVNIIQNNPSDEHSDMTLFFLYFHLLN